MNKELLKLKKELLKAYSPTREEQVAKALRIVFSSIGEKDISDIEQEEKMTYSEALKVLDWESFEFEGVDRGDVTIIDNGKYEPIVFAKKDFPNIEGATIFTNEDMLED